MELVVSVLEVGSVLLFIMIVKCASSRESPATGRMFLLPST